MNTSMIRFLLGQIIKIEGVILLLPCVMALIFGEQEGFVYLFMGLMCIALGFAFSRKRPENTVFYLKEGCIITALSWIVLSLFGGLPFFLTGEIPSFTDAMFESASGFTTTGSSILTNVEALSYTSLFWRSFTHWIGGMGVLVFLLAILPMAGGSNIHLMRAESPGPSVGKLVPKMRHTARILYLIYLALTLIQLVLMLLTGMPWFDAVCITLGTAGTGGFGVRNDGCASYPMAVIWIISIFMVLFGTNFNVYFYMIFGQWKKILKMEEVRMYFLIIGVSVLCITIGILGMTSGFFEALTHSMFTVAAIISSTGYATLDFNLWPGFCKGILVVLMFVGACAGSTGGGFKVSRVLVSLKRITHELYSYAHPKSVKQVTMDGKEVEPSVLYSIGVYTITYLTIFVVSVLLISFNGYDGTTTFTSVATTLNNIGPGLGLVGPTSNFAHFTDFSKWVFIFDMIAGRLELFPLLMLFYPQIWKDLFTRTFIHKKKA